MTTRCQNIVRVSTVASLFAVAAMTLTGCSSNKSAKSMNTKPNASEMANASESESYSAPEMAADDYTALTRGQEFSVRLPTYCGSQRAWRITPASAEDRFVELLDRHSQQVEEGMSDTLDAPSYDVFTFRAIKNGETNIHFIYDQPLHTERGAVRMHTLTCNITPPTKGQGKLQQASVTVE